MFYLFNTINACVLCHEMQTSILFCTVLSFLWFGVLSFSYHDMRTSTCDLLQLLGIVNGIHFQNSCSFYELLNIILVLDACLFFSGLYRFSSEAQRMLVKLSNILAQLLVCHTAIPNHMCEPREGSLRKLEERGTARASGFNFVLVRDCDSVFLIDCSNFCAPQYRCIFFMIF